MVEMFRAGPVAPEKIRRAMSFLMPMVCRCTSSRGRSAAMLGQTSSMCAPSTWSVPAK